MRGFLVAQLSPGPLSTAAAAVQAGIARWQAALPAGGLVEQREGRVTFCLYSHGDPGPGYNQHLKATPHGLELHVGPKLLWRPAADRSPVDEAQRRSLTLAPDLEGPGSENEVVFAYLRESEHLLIKTDLLNSTFVYTAQVEGLRLWSGSSAVLARLLGSELDELSCAEFIVEGNIYAHRSLYRGIRTLEPSSCIEVDRDGRERSRAYWRLEALALDSIGRVDAQRIIVDQLDREFTALRDSGRTMVMDLTGGYDSRMNLGFALRNRIRFRTIVGGPPGSGDVRVSHRLARNFGVDHTWVLPPRGTLAQWRAALDGAAACTDLEYDAVEYAHIWNVHRNHYGPDEVSLHGSTADLTRHYYFYPIEPYGQLALERMVLKKFGPSVDSRTFLHPSIALDWVPHMLARFAETDDVSLPAFARVNNIYLRLRMQYWQGRIASSTNRIHASFTPWTSMPILEAILTTRWRELENRSLTRHLVRDVHPGLDRVPMEGGSLAGVGAGAAIRALPSAVRFYSGKVWSRLRPKGPAAAPALVDLPSHVSARADRLEGLLHPDALRRLQQDGMSAAPVLGRLYTLIEAREAVAAWHRAR